MISGASPDLIVPRLAEKAPPTANRRSSPRAHRLLLSDLAVILTVIATIGLFAVSPLTLEAQGFAYLTSGGGVFSKFHPSTLLALTAFALRCLVTRNPLRSAWRLATADTGAVLLLAAFVIAAFYAVIISKTPVTPLVDTFALPVLMFLLLRDLDPAVMRWLALLIALVLCINAVLAFVEILRSWRLISVDVPVGASADPRRGDAIFDWRAQMALDWRASALLGHPLVNGLIVGSFVLCLAAPGSRWMPFSVRAALILVQFASLFCFGARTALVLTIAFGGWLGLGQAIEALRRGTRVRPRRVAVVLFVLCLAIAVGAILMQTGFLDRTIDRFQDDGGSAATRITMFDLFQPLSLSDALFGPNPEVVATWQRLEGLEFGIESSWIGLALIYGVIVTAILVVGLLSLAGSVIKACGRGTACVLAFYFILVSVSASMSGKTTTFAMTIILTLVFLRKDESRRPMWRKTDVGVA